jgi:hypothetical protein
VQEEKKRREKGTEKKATEGKEKKGKERRREKLADVHWPRTGSALKRGSLAAADPGAEKVPRRK